MNISRKQWICDECKVSFSRRFTLERHIRSLHIASIDNTCLVCNLCKKRFNRLENLKRHQKRVGSCIKPIIFKCASCDYSSKKKSNLVRHERRHTDCTKERQHKNCSKDRCELELFECFACEFKTNYKSALVAHLRRHDNVKLEFECAHCNQKFTCKSKLTEHIKLEHLNIRQVNIKVLKCLECHQTFKRKSILFNHYQQAHHITLQWEELMFDSKEEFEKWKVDLQRSTRTQFISRNFNKTSSYISRDFWCHRSGCYVSKCENAKRKRLLKEYGSKKLNGICPAGISIKIYGDGKVSMRIQKTHVGHCLEDPKELRHIYLDKTEKDNIAAKLHAGVPITEIKIRETLSNESQEMSNRGWLINYDDVYNAGRTRGVLHRLHKPSKSEELNIDTFISQHQDSVLFFKPEYEEDTQYNILTQEDFALVLMNKWQENALKQYAWKVVCMDRTHDTNMYNFILHTLLILDVDRECIPVAFLLSNRSDEWVIDIFLQCIRECAGQIKTTTFVSDMAPSYYDSWSKWMGPPEFHLHCSWRIHEAWQTNLSKIANKSKREIVRKTIYDLIQELDQGAFEKKLEEFLTQKDPDIQVFLNYFMEHYSDVSRWAYCYQKFALVNTDTHLEAFYRNLKSVVASRKKIKSLQDCLNYLYDFIVLKKNDIDIKEIRGKNTKKRRNLRKSHKEAVRYLENIEVPDIISLNDGSWLVGSFESFQMYAVKKYEVKECFRYGKECHLQCSLCNICYHEYCCDCMEFTIRQNMCKHIHALGIHLKNLRNDNNNLPDEKEPVGYRNTYADEDCMRCKEGSFSENIVSENAEVIENLKAKMKEEFHEVLDYATTIEDLSLIECSFLEPMKSSLVVLKMEQNKREKE